MYTQSEHDKKMLAKQTERQTVEQLKVENRLLKDQNRKIRSGAREGQKVRNYAIKEDLAENSHHVDDEHDEQRSDFDEGLINFFSSNNKDL